ncbi:hypothetical protein J9303_11325 [Bacillaceae bacterium Marseille-Q3522]|nr:hypothetical protein [Bacillaceae bacterium Marseille-Q3522]
MKNFKQLKEMAQQNPVIKNYLDSFSSQIGTEIFKTRVRKNYSQKKLAELCEVSMTRP